MRMTRPLDCLVIGAGPAGLTASIYLARCHLAIRLVDAGHSRAALIPRTRNHAGFPGGIAGTDLLARMREQAQEYGVAVQHGTVDRLVKSGDHFTADVRAETLTTRTVLLTTGVVNNPPPMDQGDHDSAVSRGLLRYCPICDGYEVTDKRVAVIGTGERGTNEAIYLRMYTRDVSLIAPAGAHALDDAQRSRLAEAHIAIIDGPCGPLRMGEATIHVPLADGELAFDTAYPAMGSVIRSDLAKMVAAEMTDEGCLQIDQHQRTTTAGLYTAGDVAKGLDQISHAMGEASVASATIRNDLAAITPLFR